MNTTRKYQQGSPWPSGNHPQVLFILDTCNSFEQDLLKGWIEHHRESGGTAAQTVCVDLSDDHRSIDSVLLVNALTLPIDTVVAPLRIAWLPSQESIHSGPRLRDLIFGDPRHPNPRRGRKILKTAPQRMHLLSGKPDSVANLRARFELHHKIDNRDSQRDFADFVARQASVVLDLAERRLQGGRYKVPRYVAANLMASTSYNEALDTLSAESGIAKAQLVKDAKGYLDEMVSRPSMFWLDVYARFNKFCLGLGYEAEIVCDQEVVEKLRQIVREYPSMLLWTHKTYLDGMVLPKLLYDNDFPMPHMFGGANLNFPGLGFLLHRSGTIFIRRSFQDNELYKMTLRHYVGYLMGKRFPMNWAFEGTRSRLGKLMPPRYGLLKYVLEACDATDARDIHIIPISISYDLIRDVEEYATEQTSHGKGAESLRWLIGYLRSLTRPMGKIYVDIGEPVVLNKAPDPDDRLALSKIAFEVAVEANHVTAITFPSLATMSLLGAAPKALTEKEVVADLNALLRWANARDIRVSKDFNLTFADHISSLLGIMLNEGIVTLYDEGPEVVYGIGLNQHTVASYYRNTVIHFFVNKAIIELALLKASENEGPDALNVFWAEVDQLRDLFKFEFFYAPTEIFHQQIREELSRYDEDWQTLLSQGTFAFGQLLNRMTPLVSHVTLLIFTEAYSIVAALAARMAYSETLVEQACVADALKLGRQAYLQRRINSEASIGKLLFNNGFKMLQNRGLTDAGEPTLAKRRLKQSHQLRDLLRRLDLIRAIGVASRGS
ncbi:glycerol-3-phosphate 1-O-acyltransferase [Halioglobus sp. Uisw_031]|uniref:glycerol-3-phosphate 1-O-acyltransferase n=1 Tax=Halioglobus sp. Uisw_031 TaxID=3230977 RepID=UPI0039ED60F2